MPVGAHGKLTLDRRLLMRCYCRPRVLYTDIPQAGSRGQCRSERGRPSKLPKNGLLVEMRPLAPPKSASGKGRSHPFQPNLIVDSVSEFLLAAQVSFRRLNGGVTQKKLNLFQLSACEVAQTSAGPPQVMGSKVARRYAPLAFLRGPSSPGKPTRIRNPIPRKKAAEEAILRLPPRYPNAVSARYGAPT
jgi:hypothetical protein